VGELEDVVGDFDVPLELLPGAVPPVSGEGVGAGGADDFASVGAGEDGEGMLEVAAFFRQDTDSDGRAEARHGEVSGRGDGEGGDFMEVGGGGVHAEAVGTVGVLDLGDAQAVGADEAGEAVEGVGEAVGVAEAFAEDFVLLVGGECGDKAEGKSGDGGGGADGIEVGVEGAEEDFRIQGGFC